MVSRAAALGIGWLLGSYETALILFASVGVIVNLWQWYYIENMLKQPDDHSVATEG